MFGLGVRGVAAHLFPFVLGREERRPSSGIPERPYTTRHARVRPGVMGPSQHADVAQPMHHDMNLDPSLCQHYFSLVFPERMTVRARKQRPERRYQKFVPIPARSAAVVRPCSSTHLHSRGLRPSEAPTKARMLQGRGTSTRPCMRARRPC